MEVTLHLKISYENKKQKHNKTPLLFRAFGILELQIRECGLTTTKTLEMLIIAIIYKMAICIRQYTEHFCINSFNPVNFMR